jgi:hypothetical protein
MPQPSRRRIVQYVPRDLQSSEGGQACIPQPSDDLVPRPSPADVRAAVDRIRDSRTLKGCNKLMQLLDFLVETTLGGESDYLKETTIGVFVFGRQPDYDPKLDTIVRSQAWRLRTKLEKYYAGEGNLDSIVILLPRGHYVPNFEFRQFTNA